MSLQICHAFRWIGSNDEQPNNICRILDKDSLCLSSSNNPVEVYTDVNEPFLDCAGWYKLNNSKMISHFEKSLNQPMPTIIYIFSNSYVKSTVNGDHLAIGHLAQKHVEEEKNHEQDKRSLLQQMEG